MDDGGRRWRALEEPAAERAREQEARRETSGTGTATPRGGPSTRQWALAAAGVAMAIILAAVALALARTDTTELVLAGVEAGDTPAASASAAGTPPEIVVDIGGAVQRPGVYRLAAGSRVADAIAAAGGYSQRVDVAAASDRLNLAAVLADGERVRVPARGEAAGSSIGGAGAGDPASAAESGLVDLNRATAAELEALPGIGPVTANKIIAARETAPFTSVDELRSRDLVGAATFDAIRALVTVGR